MANITQIQNINEFIKAFLTTHGVDEEIFEQWKNDENQQAVEALMKTLTNRLAKEKKFKDPNAPKRGKSAYLFFCAENREKVKADLGEEAKATEVTAELGVRWNTLKATMEAAPLTVPAARGVAAQKQAKKDFDKYTKMAEEDKERYAAEMAEYTPPSDEELAEMGEAKKGRRAKSPGDSPKAKKDPKAPKRPKSGYLFFCAEVREEVKAELDDPSAKNVMAEFGIKWAELKEGAEKGDKKADKEYNRYLKMAEEDKERYAAEMAEYTPPSGDEAEVVPKKKAPAKKSKSDDEAEEPKVVKEKPAKKKTTGYVLFCQEFRPEVKEDNPDLPQVEITKLLAQMWKDLPEEEKEEWKEKAAVA